MIRVLIADDHPIVRRGLRDILAGQADLTVAGEARDGEEVLALAAARSWDVVVLDITMPGRNGLDVLRELRHLRPELPVLILSIHPEDQYAVRALQAGAAGYLTKESAPEELLGAIRKAVQGRKYVSPSLAERLATLLDAGSVEAPHERLSDREYLVLRMLAAGKTVGQIADRLSLSVKTISTYRRRILVKMNMESNAELMRYAMQNRLVDGEAE